MPHPRTAAFVTLSALLIPAAALAVDAPRAPEPTTTGSATGLPPGVLPAPVGHRQPRAADVPDEARGSSELRGSDAWINGVNRDIDRRLNICRGC